MIFELLKRAVILAAPGTGIGILGRRVILSRMCISHCWKRPSLCPSKNTPMRLKRWNTAAKSRRTMICMTTRCCRRKSVRRIGMKRRGVGSFQPIGTTRSKLGLWCIPMGRSIARSCRRSKALTISKAILFILVAGTTITRAAMPWVIWRILPISELP